MLASLSRAGPGSPRPATITVTGSLRHRPGGSTGAGHGAGSSRLERRQDDVRGSDQAPCEDRLRQAWTGSGSNLADDHPGSPGEHGKARAGRVQLGRSEQRGRIPARRSRKDPCRTGRCSGPRVRLPCMFLLMAGSLSAGNLQSWSEARLKVLDSDLMEVTVGGLARIRDSLESLCERHVGRPDIADFNRYRQRFDVERLRVRVSPWLHQSLAFQREGFIRSRSRLGFRGRIASGHSLKGAYQFESIEGGRAWRPRHAIYTEWSYDLDPREKASQWSAPRSGRSGSPSGGVARWKQSVDSGMPV